jgi:uncharacterized repeat protein (TIGR03803 family)
MRFERLARITGPIAAATVLTLVPVQQTQGLLAAQTAAPTFTPAARVCSVHDFNPLTSDPALPSQIGAITPGDDGLYYSTSPSGGKSTVTANQGTIFRFSTDPSDLITHGADKLEVLYNFDLLAHGSSPMGGLTKGTDGFYGTTRAGGLYTLNAKGATKLGNGVLFRFKSGDTEPEVLHTFRYGDLTGITPEVCQANQPCRYSPQQRMNAAAGIPLSAPVLASDGSLYGVTSGAIGFPNLGVLYKVAPYKGESGITALCVGGSMPAFDAQLPDAQVNAQLRDACMFNGKYGNLPLALIAGPEGDLYGTTLQVSATSNGTVFRVDLPSGHVTTLYDFPDPKDGMAPYGLILASDGNLYGVTKYGGPLYGPGNPGAGVLYRLAPTGGNFQIIHAFNGTTDGSMPVAGLVEEKSFYGDYLYGSTSGGGDLRGVLFRVRLDTTPGTPSFEVVYTFPNQWSVAGAFPASTMAAANDKTYGLTFYGTTLNGGTSNYGALFRLSGVHLPPMQNLPAPVFYALRSDSKHVGAVFQIPGQPQTSSIDMYSGATARMGAQVGPTTDNGMMIRVGNCRSPHIVQFIAREIIEADGTYKAGTYTEMSGRSYQFTTNDTSLFWDTDSSALPNAYYDEQAGAPDTMTPISLVTFDQPSFSSVYYLPDVHETWRTRIKDYVICNCQVVKEVLWTREVPWIPDLPTGNNVTVDINKGQQGPPEYVDMSITDPDDPQLVWVNGQIQKDGFLPVP